LFLEGAYTVLAHSCG